MRRLNLVLLFTAISATALTTHAQSVSHDSGVQDNIMTIDARNGAPTVPITIGEDVYTFLVDPSFGDTTIVNASIAEKHEIWNANIFGLKANFEGTKLKTKGGGIDIEIGDFFKERSKLFFWFEEDIYPAYDGVIGAGSFKEFDKVIFLLSDVNTQQKIYSAPLKSKEDWRVETVFGEGERLKAVYRFSLHSEHTFTNLLLSQTLRDKSLVAPKTEVTDIVRTFSTDAKIINSNLAMAIPLLRGDRDQIKMQTPINSFETSEEDIVIVKKTRKKKKAREGHQIYLGRDYFNGCTSLEFVPEEKRVDLYCDDNDGD